MMRDIDDPALWQHPGQEGIFGCNNGLEVYPLEPKERGWGESVVGEITALQA